MDEKKVNENEKEIDRILEEFDDLKINIQKKQETQTNINEFEDIDSGEKVELSQNEVEFDEEIEPTRPKRKSKKAIRGLIMALIIVAISVGLAFGILGVINDVLAIYKPDQEIIVTIPKSASTEQIAKILKKNGVISMPTVFRVVSKINKADGTYQYGDYILNSKMSYPSIIAQLQKATDMRKAKKVTLVEGTSIYVMAQELEKQGICDAQDFLDTARTQSFAFDFERNISNSNLKMHKLEGFIMPDTYEFYQNETPENVVEKILKNFEKKVNITMINRAKELNMSLEDVIILASIVQNEAPVESEMKKVAGVFFNRLKDKANFPRLESDTTNKYIREIIKPNLVESNDAMVNAYDSYKTAGFPPSAIGNPGLAAIKATLYYENVPYLYFCSNLNTKQFFYAKTLAEQSANLRKAGLK